MAIHIMCILCMTKQFYVCCLPVMFTDCFYDDVKEEVTIQDYLKFCPQFDDNVYQVRRNAHRAIEMCVHMSPGTEGVVDAKLVPVLVGKLLKEEDEIKVCMIMCLC